MKSRIPLRSLLTTTSVAALLVAPVAGRAGETITTPAQSYTLESDTEFVSIQTTLSNSIGVNGVTIAADVDVYGSGANDVSVTSSAIIDVDDASATGDYGGDLYGILVEAGNDIYGGIENDGLIDVEAADAGEGSGYRSATGIGVRGDNYVPYITNDGTINVNATHDNSEESSVEGTSDVDARATAFGVRREGYSDGFYNSGSISVEAAASAQASAYASGDEEGSGDVFAYASGVAYAAGVEFVSIEVGEYEEYDFVLGEFANSDTITVNANANVNSYANADVSCTVSDEGCDEYGDMLADSNGDLQATAYGVNLDGDLSAIGRFDNSGAIQAASNSRLLSYAYADAEEGDAFARAGQHHVEYSDEEYYTEADTAYVDVAGVRQDVLLVDGDFDNSGVISAQAALDVELDAQARGEEYSEAEAGLYASLDATGVDIRALLFDGDFINSGRIQADATLNIENSEEEPAGAFASGYDYASAEVDIYGNANATGVAIDTHSLTGDFRSSGDSEEGGIYATAQINADVAAEANSSYYDADADAQTSFDAYAVGIDLDVGTLAGHFVNSGPVAAEAGINLSSYAEAVGGDESSAAAYGSNEAYAAAIVAEFDTLGGSFINTGAVSGAAHVTLDTSALAEGSDYLSAFAGQYAFANATGIEFETDTIEDNFRNEGAVSVSALAQSAINAHARVHDGEDGDAFASGGFYYGPSNSVVAQATGLDLYIGRIGGYIANSGGIDVSADARLDVDVSAEAGDTGDAGAWAGGYAKADAYGIYLEMDAAGYLLDELDDVSEGDGFFFNTGDLDVAATAVIDIAANAYADEGYAVSVAEAYGDFYEDDSGTAYAVGIDMRPNYSEDSEEESDWGFSGSVINEGDLTVSAYVDAQVSASASVDEGDEEYSAALAGAGGMMSAYAVGFAMEDMSVDGIVANGGEIDVTANTHATVRARAVSDDSPAGAVIAAQFSSEDLDLDFDEPSLIGSFAAGIDLEDVYLGGGFLNEDEIGVSAQTTYEAEAEARGDEEAHAAIFAVIGAQAVGVNMSDVALGDTLVNHGAIHVSSDLYADLSAHAYGDAADALIAGYDQPAMSYVGAVGVQVSSEDEIDFINAYDSEDDDFEDSGFIYAEAHSNKRVEARASGEDEATATAAFADQIQATGVSIDGGAGGAFTNQGWIVAEATGGDEFHDEEGGVEARAETLDGVATANAYDDVEATAYGVRTSSHIFLNEGLIGAGADANAYARAEARSDDEAYADAEASASAFAVGVSVNGSDWQNGSFSNLGLIEAYASAYAVASAEASADETEEAYAEAAAYASAIGVELASSVFFDTIDNGEDATISVSAYAYATEAENGDENDGYSHANATGMALDHIRFNTLTNDGDIAVSAYAEDEADAVGIAVFGGNPSYSGAIVNTGTISAEAGAEEATATAIGVYDGGRVSSITNTGTISASVMGEDSFEYEDGEAIAIDLRGSGIGATINQFDGAIVGDIQMAQGTYSSEGLADAINWSGGTITGDIFGDYEEDNINIFVGENNAFTYDGTIDGLNRFGINYGEDEDAAITVRITNTVRNTAEVFVGRNATLALGTQASIGTDHLDLDASSTLVFDVTSDGVNGVINTGTADLGGATVKARFIDPWLPDSQVYRIINWDGDEETRFGSVISSSILEKVIAQYGEDGVDLLATRLKFADLSGLEDDATSFGKALDRIFDDIDPDSPLGQAITLLIQLTPDQFAYEMSQIAGQQTADVQHVTLSQLGSLIHVIQTQINENRTGALRGSGDDVAVRFGSGGFSVSSGDDDALSGVNAGDETMKGDWAAWARVFGDWSKLDASGTAAGFKADSGGVVVGVDYSPSDALMLGLAGGYQTSDLTFGNAGDGDIDSWSVSAYGDYRMGNAYVDLLAGYAAQSYDMNRALTVLGVNYIANSQYDGSSVFGAVEAGYEFAVGAKTTLTPFIGFNANQTKTDASTETGAGIWNLAYDDRSDEAYDGVLGSRISHDFVTDDGMKVTPTFELGWKHAFGDTSPTANASLAGTPGTQFQIFGSPTAENSAIVGAALQVQMTDAVDAYVQYNGQYSSDYTENTASLRLRWKF